MRAENGLNMSHHLKYAVKIGIAMLVRQQTLTVTVNNIFWTTKKSA